MTQVLPTYEVFFQFQWKRYERLAAFPSLTFYNNSPLYDGVSVFARFRFGQKDYWSEIYMFWQKECDWQSDGVYTSMISSSAL